MSYLTEVLSIMVSPLILKISLGEMKEKMYELPINNILG